MRKLLDEACALSEVRALHETPDGHSPRVWKQLGELGWLGLADVCIADDAEARICP